MTFISSFQTPDAIKRTFQKWLLLGTDGQRDSSESMLLVYFDDDDDDDDDDNIHIILIV